MKRAVIIIMSFLSIALLTAPAAQAAVYNDYNVNFSINFWNDAPQNLVTGSFSYKAASITSEIASIESINLTIYGHVYELSEIGILNNIANGFLGIGRLPSVDGLTPGTDDFGLSWHYDTQEFFGLLYTTSGTSGHYQSISDGSYFRIEQSPVPIPGAFWLFGSGLVGLVGIRRKMKK